MKPLNHMINYKSPIHFLWFCFKLVPTKMSTSHECKTTRRKSGKIPEFGNWDYSNELPITQYFESARQAGLIRYTTSSSSSCSSSRDCDLYMVSSHEDHFFNNYNSSNAPPPLPIKARSRRRSTRTSKESDLTTKVREPLPRKNQVLLVPRNNYYDDALTVRALVPKPVDEDLYKISPDLLRSSKQKRAVGFFPRCLRPPCMV